MIKKSLKLSLIIFSLFSLSSCSAFFNTESNSIKDVVTEVQDNGDTKITITFDSSSKPEVTFTIPKGQEGKGIKDVSAEYDELNKNIKLILTYTDDTTYEFFIPVIQGEKGRGIKSIESKINEETGLQEITIYYDDDSEPTIFSIPNGKDGNGIKNVSSVTQDDGTILITITYTDSTMNPTQIYIPKGNGISSIETSEDETTYTLKITFDNGDVEEYSFSKPHASTWLYGTSDPVDTLGNIGDFYFNTSSGDIFVKKEVDEVATWVFQVHINGVATGFNEWYFVKLDPNGGTIEENYPSSYRVKPGTCLDLPLCTKEGYEFIGWYSDLELDVNSGQFTNTTPVFQDWTLYAQYKAL